MFKKNQEIKFNQKAITGTFYAKNVKPIAYQWFKNSGILALIPISKNEVSMVLSYPGKNHIINPRIYLNNFFKRELTSVCGDQNLNNIDFNSFDLSYTKPIFFKNNFVFFGDSCQAIHPLAGQGLNLGIKDVSVFAELIKEKTSQNITLKKLMYDYRRNRIFERVFFHKLTYSIAFLNFENNLLFEKFSSLFLKILNQSNYLKQKVINVANGGNIIIKYLSYFNLYFFSCHAFSSEDIRLQLKKKLPDIDIGEIRKLDDSLMYEVILNDDLFYVDGEIKYIIRGELIEISSLKNISIDRKKELEAIKNKKLEIPFDDYPLQHAIKINEGQGPYKVIYFADPYCGYCKKFDKEVISKLKDTTVYLFLYPILSEKSINTSEDIYCSANQANAWIDFIINGTLPIRKKCKTSIEDIMTFGKKMKIRGTPTLIFADGRRVPGALSYDQFRKI